MGEPAYISEAAVADLESLEEVHRQYAQKDRAAFCSYVLRDEETNGRIFNSENHKIWHALANKHDRLVIWGHFESGKSQQMAVGGSLFELGRNPKLRIVCMMNTDGQAQKICMQVGKYIDQSVALHEVFPDLKSDGDLPWTKHQLYVDRETLSKDPSFQTCGLHGNILGSRIDLLIIDDILDYESTRSSYLLEDTIRWFKQTTAGRLTAKARIWALGMVWKSDDLLHWLAKKARYVATRSPILNDAMGSTWPSQWPMERINTWKEEWGPIEFMRQMMCREVSDEEARFKPAWIDLCKKKGEGKDLCYALHSVPPGYRTITGVDLGVRDKENSAETAMFTIVVHPDETREVLCIEAGKWHGPEIVDRIIDTHRRFDSVSHVENVAAQDFIIQFTRDKSAAPVKPFMTTGAKHHPEFGVESIGAEMAAGKWIIPNHNGVCNTEVQKWINELIYYDPRAHTGDRLMASWFAREGARIAAKKKVRRGRINLMSR